MATVVNFHVSSVLVAFLEAEYALHNSLELASRVCKLFHRTCFSGDVLNSKGGEKSCLEASVDQFDWNGGLEEKKSERRY